MRALGRMVVAALLFTAGLLLHRDFRGVLSWAERVHRRYYKRDYHVRLHYQVITSLLMCISVLIAISAIATLVKG